MGVWGIMYLDGERHGPQEDEPRVVLDVVWPHWEVVERFVQQLVERLVKLHVKQLVKPLVEQLVED